MVFADLSGFTALSEQLDPEEVRALVDGCMARLGRIVEELGGSVDKVIGDALMAVFGAPTAHGDDAERAVRAALQMHCCAVEHSEEFGALSLRIGVNTGEVMFAPVGPEGARDLTVMGDPVNVASRLCGAASAGHTLVGAKTYHATRRAIAYDPVEPLRVKGKVAPLAAWLARETIIPTERPLGHAPMVGRADELHLLTSTWARVVSEGRAHLVTVLGPTGIGKTRLVREFTLLVEMQAGRVLQGRSLPYGETAGYRSFAQQVKEAGGILDTDPASAAREKLLFLMHDLLPPEGAADDVAGRLALLAGFGATGVDADKGPLFSSARSFVEAIAGSQPTVFVFEDMQWSDPTLFELVEFLAGRCRAPALLLASARPELLDRRPGWSGGLASSLTLQLDPLPEAECRELVQFLMPDATDPAIAERLVDAAGGNPLFLEEFAASFAERTTEITDSLPTNVQAIVAARLDALRADERQVLFDASVVGTTFWRGALERLEGDRPLDKLLDVLEAKDLIRRESISLLAHDRQFSFRHMLVQEVAYATLTRAARRARHAAVARFVEDAAGDRISESASLLVHHWREAGDVARTVHYLLLAAAHASRAWAKTEAVALYTQTLELLPEDDTDLRLSVRLLRASTLLDGGYYAEAVPELEALIPKLEGEQLLEALLRRGRAAVWLADPDAANSFAAQAMKLAEALANQEQRARALSLLNQCLFLDGRTVEGAALGEEALVVWPSHAQPTALASHLSFLSVSYYFLGEYARGAELAQQGYQLGSESHGVEGMLFGGASLGVALVGLGRHHEALHLLEQVVNQGHEVELQPRLTAWAMNAWGGALREVLDLVSARRHNDEAIEVAARSGFLYAELQGRIDLLFIDLAEREIGRAEQSWPALWEKAQATKGLHQWLMAGRLATARAEIELASGRAEAAAAAASRAVAYAEKYGRRKYEVASRLVLGSALLRLERYAEALAELRRAIAGADRLGHPPLRWRTAYALSQALVAVGDDEGAAAASITAAHTVRGFAETLSDDRRAHLLKAPSVAEVLASPS